MASGIQITISKTFVTGVIALVFLMIILFFLQLTLTSDGFTLDPPSGPFEESRTLYQWYRFCTTDNSFFGFDFTSEGCNAILFVTYLILVFIVVSLILIIKGVIKTR